MLETIHEYARERLLGSGDEQTIRNRHLDYFRELVEEMAPGFMSAGQLALFRQADAEMDNIRTAFEWAVNSGQIEKAARLITVVRETGEVMREEMNKHNLCLVAYMDGDYVRAYDLLMPVIYKEEGFVAAEARCCGCICSTERHPDPLRRP